MFNAASQLLKIQFIKNLFIVQSFDHSLIYTVYTCICFYFLWTEHGKEHLIEEYRQYIVKLPSAE